ncbi:MAG: hypothetical protein N2515_01325, partial [Deltaproteobacteria bacterium]|nr:hypothetical protein [Deltaproteobacteria bacterium]
MLGFSRCTKRVPGLPPKGNSMRLESTLSALKQGFFGVGAFGLALFAVGLAHAQSSSEFDDEFDERNWGVGAPRGPAPPQQGAQTQPSLSTSTEGEFGDAQGPAPEAGPAPLAASPSRIEARGDLLKSEGPPSWRKRRFVFHNTYQGAVGGLHVVDAGSGPSRTFRVQLLTDFFVQSGFLRAPGSPPTVSDENRHVGGSLSLSYTPFDFIELYGSIRSHANSNATESPALFQVLGDTNLGLKGYIELVPWWILGLDVGVHLLNTVGDIGLVLDSTSLGFRLSTAVDLRAAEGIAFPFVARLNLRYFYDRSEALITGIERARYEALPSTGPDARRSYEDEDRHLLSRVERFALQINRMDFFDIGIGTEFPIEAGSEVIVSPIVEWVLRIPVNSRNYSCLWIPETPGGTTPAPGQDGCLAYQGFAAMPSNLTFALRMQPGIKGFALFGGADIGVSGQTFVRELAGNAPYNIYLGASYAVDTLPPPPQIVEREV